MAELGIRFTSCLAWSDLPGNIFMQHQQHFLSLWLIRTSATQTYVAGNRVVLDAFCKPFSMGRCGRCRPNLPALALRVPFFCPKSPNVAEDRKHSGLVSLLS